MLALVYVILLGLDRHRDGISLTPGYNLSLPDRLAQLSGPTDLATILVECPG